MLKNQKWANALGSILTKGRRTVAIALVGGTVAVGAMGAAPAPAYADGLRVVTANFAPLTDNTSAKKGLLYDLVAAMMKLQNESTPIEFMGWADAVKISKEQKNVLIFPMTRTPSREADYVWLTKIFDMDRSYAGRPGSAPVGNTAAAKALAGVGTTVNSASLDYLKKQGLTNIVEFPTSRELMKALLDGKVDAAYQPNPFSKADWKAVGGQGALVLGEPQERSAAYLAASKGSDAKPDDWQGALQVLEQEGVVEKTVAEYGMN